MIWYDIFTKVMLGAMGRRLCLVAAILQYMAHMRPAGAASPGPFFVFSDGRPLTR